MVPNAVSSYTRDSYGRYCNSLTPDAAVAAVAHVWAVGCAHEMYPTLGFPNCTGGFVSKPGYRRRQDNAATLGHVHILALTGPSVQ